MDDDEEEWRWLWCGGGCGGGGLDMGPTLLKKAEMDEESARESYDSSSPPPVLEDCRLPVLLAESITPIFTKNEKT